ncbi:hypothetical protein DFP73DRAFT_622294 [Morchella snyderi]|nr:hypothetical protein DFP73DRAFT_622294 [Morchella snyderi]
MSSTTAKDPGQPLSKRTKARRARAAQNRYDKPIRPLREIAPKSSTLVDGKDPREGALAEEIRMVQAAELAEEVLKLSSVTGSKVELNGRVTDPDLDGEYSTDEECILQIEAGHNLSSTQAVDELFSEDLRTGTYMYQNNVMRPKAPFFPDVMLTSPAEYLQTLEPSAIHNGGETAETSLRPTLRVPGPSSRPFQAVGELRRSPRRHMRRGTTGILKRRTSALQVTLSPSIARSGSPGEERVPEAGYNVDEKKALAVLPGVGSGRASEVFLRIGEGKAPGIIHIVGKGNGIKVNSIIDKGRAPEVVDRIEKHKTPNRILRAARRKTSGTVRKLGSERTPGAITEFHEGTGTQPFRTLNKGKAPEVLMHYEDGTIDPVLLSKNPNVDLWLSERVGSMKTDGMRLHSNFELPPGINSETPTIGSEQPLPQSENDIIEAQMRANEGVEWAYDPQAYSYFDLAFFPEHSSDQVQGDIEMLQFFKSSMKVGGPVAGTSDQNAANLFPYALPLEGLTISTLTGLPVYDWGFQEHNSEETKLPDANDFGYFLEKTNAEGVAVRTFYPYTEEDDGPLN